MAIKNGVSHYSKGKKETIVNFPNKEICCFHCIYKRDKTTNGHLRIICIDTYESLNDIDIYSHRGIDCQLIFENGPQISGGQKSE